MGYTTFMKIESIEYIPIRIPKRGMKGVREWKTALGNNPFGDAVVVVLLADGCQGFGEVSSIWDGGAGCLAAAWGKRVAEAVVGADVFAVTEVLSRMDRAVAWSKNALCLKAGVEMALYDLIGKLKAMPIYQLLGGKRRESIPLSHSIAMGTVEERVAQVAEHVAAGFKTVKVKVGLDFEKDLEAVRAIRERFGPELGIRVDANMGWGDQKTLLKVVERLSELNILSIEQPFAPHELDKLAFLRRHCSIPIMLDESIWDPGDALAAIKADAGDIFNVYVSEAGGLNKAMQIANLCETAGIGFCIGSMPEFGIGTAAELHLGLAAPRIDHPSDVIGNLYFEDDIIQETLPVKDGLAYGLDRPGLGVSLDWDKVNKYRSDK
jgi:L-alanine-DL-glutamate epimerase-like enolase superfamily enzyme